MKFSRVICSLLASAFLFLSLFTPQSAFTGESTALAAESGAPVVADEKDFTYIPVPAGNPMRVLITAYTGSLSKIIIPDTLGGYPVELMSSEVFKSCKNLTYVKIPAGVSSVSGQTFAECRSLTEIDIDSENTYYTVQDGILYNKDKTSLIAFPNGIGGEFTVPESVTTISSYAFAGAYKLTKVNMYNSVTVISQSAFQGCFSLNEIRLSDNLTVLGKKALANCDDLREIHLPASLRVIGDDAVLGNIDSNNSKYYYFTDGIYCVDGSVAYNYVSNLGIGSPYLKTETRTLTDPLTGVQIVDTDGVLPLDKSIVFTVTPVSDNTLGALLPTRYNTLTAFDISLTCDEEEYTPSDKLIFRFDKLPSGTVIGSAKIYRVEGENVFELVRSPHTPFAAAQSKNTGRYIIITNNDFSLKGDVDGDGIITSYDARYTLCLAANLVTEVTTEQINAADVNAENGVTTDDARLILRRAAGIIDSFD